LSVPNLLIQPSSGVFRSSSVAVIRARVEDCVLFSDSGSVWYPNRLRCCIAARSTANSCFSAF
jgi:hypothetical protein